MFLIKMSKYTNRISSVLYELSRLSYGRIKGCIYPLFRFFSSSNVKMSSFGFTVVSVAIDPVSESKHLYNDNDFVADRKSSL